jgi:hypothetical protein
VLLTQHPVSPISIHITPANVSRIAETNQETVTQDADNQENSTEGTSNGIQYDRTYQLYKIGDYLGQRKTLSLTYDTNLKIDVYSGEDSDG